MTTAELQYIQLTARIDPGEEDEGGFVVVCPELAVASQGETIDEALTNIREAIAVFLDGLKAVGDLESFLDSRSIVTYDAPPTSPSSIEVSQGEVVAALVASLGGASIAFA